MRGLSAEVIALISSERMVIGHLYEGVFNDTTLRLWTGDYDLTFEGETYLGNGWLVAPSDWKETLANQAFGQSITLTSVPLSIVALMFTQVSQANTGRMAILFFNNDRELVGSFNSFSGDLDSVKLSEGPLSSSVELSYESKQVRMREKRDLRLTDASHRVDYPDDKGFEYLSQISGKRIYWGQPDTSRTK